MERNWVVLKANLKAVRKAARKVVNWVVKKANRLVERLVVQKVVNLAGKMVAL